MAKPRKIRITSEDLAQFAAESRGRNVDWVMGLRDDNERMRALNAELLAALEALLADYVDLANSGDCGFWDPEEEAETKQIRAVIARAREAQP